MLGETPSLLGVEASDAGDVADFLRSELGLTGEGQLASALAGCPPMLMYHTWDNLRKKASKRAKRWCFCVGRGARKDVLLLWCRSILHVS